MHTPKKFFPLKPASAGSAPPRYVPAANASTHLAPPRYMPAGSAQARMAPPRYVPGQSATVPLAPPRFSALPAAASTLAPRSLGRPVVQRMEAWCEWCTKPGCHHGSICKGTGNNPGTYKGRTEDQKFLSSNFGQTVSGDTHQMEHPFGYDVLAHPLNVKRGSTSVARRIEDEAPAYHEEKPQHRKHEGTGNIKKYKRESGLNAPEYRSWQRTALDDNNPDIAMGINQMTYGHQNLGHDTVGQQQALDSYIRMVKNMGRIPWADDKGQFGYKDAPTDDMKFDMVVFRFLTIFKRPPSESEQIEIIKILGIKPSWF